MEGVERLVQMMVNISRMAQNLEDQQQANHIEEQQHPHNSSISTNSRMERMERNSMDMMVSMNLMDSQRYTSRGTTSRGCA